MIQGPALFVLNRFLTRISLLFIWEKDILEAGKTGYGIFAFWAGKE